MHCRAGGGLQVMVEQMGVTCISPIMNWFFGGCILVHISGIAELKNNRLKVTQLIIDFYIDGVAWV